MRQHIVQATVAMTALMGGLFLSPAVFADTLDDAIRALESGNPCRASRLFRAAEDEGLPIEGRDADLRARARRECRNTGLEVTDVEPEGVSVRIDGSNVGVAPGPFLELSPGTVTVVLSAPGYESTTLEVQLTDGDVFTIGDIRLTPLPVQLTVTANMSGAEISVDGTASGTYLGEPVVIEVAPGDHLVEVSLQGYPTFSRQLTLAPGTSSSVEANLELDVTCGDGTTAGSEECDDGNTRPGDGCSPGCQVEEPRLVVTCNVDGASVMVASQPLGTVRAYEEADFQVAQGRQLVEVQAPGYYPFSQESDFVAGEVVRLQVDLVAQPPPEPPRASYWYWTALGPGLALLAGGVLVATLRTGDLDELSEIQDRCQDAPCTASDISRGDELSGSLGDSKTLAWILVGTGAAATIAGTLWGLLGSSSDEEPSQQTGSVGGFRLGIGLTW